MKKELKRKIVPNTKIDLAIDQVIQKLDFRLKEKGKGTFASRHEIQGSITEEYHELVDALRGNNSEEYKQELIDIAVGAIFGIACIDNDSLDW